MRLLSSILIAWLASPLVVSAQDDGDWQSSPTDLQCVPTCRRGYECKQGECVPVCSPACGADEICTTGGRCVSTMPAPAPKSETPLYRPRTSQCMPACRAGFVCLQGECVSACNPVCPFGEVCTADGRCEPGRESIQIEPEQRATPAPAPVDRTGKDSIVNLHVDVLGMLQFGLTPTLEIGKKLSGYLRLRAVNTGIASYFALGRDRHDDLRWGLGAALGMHGFFGRDGNMRGLFAGPSLEYAYVRSRDVERDLAEYGTHALIPQLDFGYRWAWRRFLLGLGLRLGVVIPIRTTASPVGLDGCAFASSCAWDPNASFLGGIFLDLGVFL